MLQPQVPGSVPSATARVAHAAFPKGAPLLTLRDELGPIFQDDDFAALYPTLGQPAYPPWRLALVTVLQFREDLSDRKAADAVRSRIDWKYALGLDLDDPGFDASVLCEFRDRLREGEAEQVLLDRVLTACRGRGLLKTRGRQRTDSTHVVAAVREMNRLELTAETVRAALNAVAAEAPSWVAVVAPGAWYERYARRVEDSRLPQAKAKREAYAVAVGTDGFALLDAVDQGGAPAGLSTLPAITALRRVWSRHYERDGDSARLSELRGRGPEKGDGRASARPVESPYDVDARYRRKAGTTWTGYMVHLTEACDEDMPRLVVYADTTPGDVHEAVRKDAILQALDARGLSAAEHLADSAYVSAELLVAARDQYGVRLVGPPRRDASWQARTEGGYTASRFTVDWDRETAVCPQGHASRTWSEYTDRTQRTSVMVRFDPGDCRACPAQALCVRSKNGARSVHLHPRPEQEALDAMRAELATDEGRASYAARAGVEATMSQGVRSMGMRQTRYRGLGKTRLGHVATAAALSADRAAVWLGGARPAPTRTSRVAAIGTDRGLHLPRPLPYVDGRDGPGWSAARCG